MTSDKQKIAQVNRERLAAILEKYEQEAKKRLRPDGSAQFLQLSNASDNRLQALANDPWVNHDELNAQVSPIQGGNVYKYFVLGAGFGGLQYCVRLIEQGLATPEDIRMADAAGGFGGTWYWNRFPGLHCDVESYIYMPLLEETRYIPTKKYAPGNEIRLHADRIAAQWGLCDKASFRTNVRKARWDDDAQLWTIEAVQGRGPSAPPVEFEFRAEYVYLAAGVLTQPQIPKLPGLLSFSGSIFHTARWDYGVSGGSPQNEVLSGFRGKRVAVVGTAATSIAVIPEIAKYADELFVVQRTPAYVKPRGQYSTDPEEFAAKVAVKRGWQYERRVSSNRFITNAIEPGEEDLTMDGWTNMPAYSALLGSPKHGIVDPTPEHIDEHVNQYHILDLPNMEANRARVDSLVKDPETASRLKPWYPSWCKRPTFSDTYLEVFNQPNVHLLDTDGKGPSHATNNGLVVGDTEYPLDIIIFGTGYSTAGRGKGSPGARTGVEIIGQNGQTLNQKWDNKGASTLHGYMTSGFPNLFFTGSSQATATGNNVWMLDLIADHVVYIISQAQARAGRGQRAVIDVTPEAEMAHTTEILKRAAFFSALSVCTPGYFNGHGDSALATDPDEKQKRAQSVAWSEGTVSFLQYLSRWRDEGSLKGVKVTAAGISH